MLYRQKLVFVFDADTHAQPGRMTPPPPPSQIFSPMRQWLSPRPYLSLLLKTSRRCCCDCCLHDGGLPQADLAVLTWQGVAAAVLYPQARTELQQLLRQVLRARRRADSGQRLRWRCVWRLCRHAPVPQWRLLRFALTALGACVHSTTPSLGDVTVSTLIRILTSCHVSTACLISEGSAMHRRLWRSTLCPDHAGTFDNLIFQLAPGAMVYKPSGSNQNFQFCGQNFTQVLLASSFAGNDSLTTSVRSRQYHRSSTTAPVPPLQYHCSIVNILYRNIWEASSVLALCTDGRQRAYLCKYRCPTALASGVRLGTGACSWTGPRVWRLASRESPSLTRGA